MLLPRSGRKTTYATQADSIQIALPDDLGSQPYPRNLGPEVRLCIVHESSIMAQSILGGITSKIVGCEALKFLFPEIIPGKEQRMNNSQLELPRASTWNEPTFDTMGVGTRAQGRHYNRIKLDDIYGTEARDSKVVRDRAIQWFDEIEPFLISPNTDGFDLIGTRYAFDDVYDHAFEKYGDDMPRYIRSAEEYVGGKWQSYCEELLSLEKMVNLKKNRKLWFSNYQNRPEATDNPELDPSWIRYWTPTDHRNITGFTGTEKILRETDQLDKLIFVDPALDGDAGWIVTGTDYISNKPNIFVLEAERGIWPPEQLIEKIFKGVLRYQPRAVVIEEVLFSRLYRHWMESEMRHRGIFFKIIPAKTRGREKDARVKGLAPFFSAGQIFLNANQTDLIREYEYFGQGSTYHALDALAYGPEFWRASVNRDTIERQAAAEKKFLLMRDPVTGYSRI